MANSLEILRLNYLGYTQRMIESTIHCSRHTVRQVLDEAAEKNITWSLNGDIINEDLEKTCFPGKYKITNMYHGCVERVVGENALTERAEACGIDLTRFAGRKPLYCDIGAMAEDGDAHAKELIKDLAVDLSFAISNLITLFNPSLVVIGGMGVNLGPFFLSNIRDEVQNSGFKEFVSNTWIQYSTLGLDSELGGAARYYIDHYYDFFEQMQGGLYAD